MHIFCVTQSHRVHIQSAAMNDFTRPISFRSSALKVARNLESLPIFHHERSQGSAPAPSVPPRTSYRLLDKVTIVIGASSGLGRAIAIAYAAKGAAVVCADLDPVANIHLKEGM